MNEVDQILFDAEFLFLVKLLGRTITVDAPLATYRLHEESKTVGAPLRRAHAYAGFYRQLLARPEIPPALRAIEAEGRAASYRYAATLYYAGHEHARARRLVIRSFLLNPRGIDRRALFVLLKSLLPRQLRSLRPARAAVAAD
jgi:hypothetical protein